MIIRTSESAGKLETAVATGTAQTAETIDGAESMDVGDEDTFSLILRYYEPPVKDAVFLHSTAPQTILT